MEEIIAKLSSYGYIILFLYSLGGGMVALIAAGILSYKGILSLEVSIAVAALANFAGDMLLVYLSRFNKQAIMPYIKQHRRKLALAHLLMKKYGDKIIIIKKFIYGVRTVVSIAVGFTKYSMLKFGIINFFAALIWALCIGYGSFYAGSYIEKAATFAGENSWFAPVILVVFLGSVLLYMNMATKKKVKKQR